MQKRNSKIETIGEIMTDRNGSRNSNPDFAAPKKSGKRWSRCGNRDSSPSFADSNLKRLKFRIPIHKNKIGA